MLFRSAYEIGEMILRDWSSDVCSSDLLSEKYDTIKDTYFWDCNYTWVANLIREYLDTPRDQILIKEFENDKYGLIDILRKYDKRISKTKRDNIKI